MKKILIIHTTNATLNGITSVIINYACKTYHLVQYDFVLCGEVDQGCVEKFKQFGNVLIAPCSRVKRTFEYTLWLKKLMKQNRYEAIHVHGNSGTMYFEIHTAKSMKIPVRIVHSHSTSCKFMRVHRILKPLLNRELTHALACSDSAGKWLFTCDYTVLPNGIDVEKFAFSQAVRDEYRKGLGLEDKLVIGHVGYMGTEKNHFFLLHVFKKLIKEHPEARLLLIGDGKLRPEIETFINENHLEEYVQLLGERSDVAQLYQCMDVFVLPSVYEGLGIVLIEAQSSGLPCIASTSVPQTANVLDRVKYIGIEDKDIVSWCEAIVDVAGCTSYRVGFYDRMKETVFNIDSCVDILIKTYQS